MRSKIPKPVSNDGQQVFRMKLDELIKTMGKEQADAFVEEQNIAVDDEGCVTFIAYVTEDDSYHDYINNFAPLDKKIKPHEFIKYTAIIVSVGDLAEWWLNAGMVHTSLTALSHNTDNLFVKWSDRSLQEGVISFTTHARNFNEGILYPNVGLSGLRDFEHVQSVIPHQDVPHSLLWLATDRPQRPQHPDGELSIYQGLAEFTKSIAECIILAAHAGITRKISNALIAPSVHEGLCFVLKECGRNPKSFSVAWENLRGNQILNDIQQAIDSNKLLFRRFVGLAEQFVLCLEGWQNK
jgi:hypothetical protein